MRYALIIAGGSGTRLWPMSTKALPKQLIPFIGDDGATQADDNPDAGNAHGGKSLLQLAMDRLKGLIEDDRIFVCASKTTEGAMLERLPGLDAARFYGEPEGRDTLNAVGLGAAERLAQDPDAVVAVFTADHLISPPDEFRQTVERGFALAQANENMLVTFGIEPTHAATGYGYLELGEPIDIKDDPATATASATASASSANDADDDEADAYLVNQFREKPDAATAQQYVDAGPANYLWNSGMFVWRAQALMNAIDAFAPDNAQGLREVAAAWHTPQREEVLNRVYPTLEKISVDFAVMEPASREERFTVAAVPMPVDWLDVGSWPAFAQTLEKDASANAASGCKSLMHQTKRTLVASNDPEHLITTIGCEDLIVIHTDKATLVCRADQAEQIKAMHGEVGRRFGEAYL